MKRIYAWLALVAALPVLLAITPHSAQRIVPGLPTYNPTWYSQTNVWWDPAALTPGTSDDATCLDATHQCLTFGQILLRYGSNSPEMPCGQSIIVHKTSAQSPAQQVADPVWFTPTMCGGGQAKLIDTLMPWDGGATATITDASFLAKQPDAAGGGNLLQISGLPAGIVAGLFVCDVTQGFSCAFIDSVPDAGIAKMEQPFTDASFNLPTNALPGAVEVNSWTPGDTVNIYSENATSLKAWNPVAGDVSDAGMFSGGWVQFTNIVDLGSGSPPSELPIIGQGENGIAGCKVDPRVHGMTLNGRGNPYSLIGNYHTGTYIHIGGGTAAVSGGGYVNGITVASGSINVGGDPVVHGTLSLQNGNMNIVALAGSTSGFYADGAIAVQTAALLRNVSGTAWMYGTASVNVGPPGTFQVPTWSQVFLTGALTQNSLSTGCVLSGLDAGAITCNIPINLTNLATQHTLRSFNTNSVFTDGTGAD